MGKLRKLLSFILNVIAFILIAGSVLSIFRNAEIRFLKMLDFPRIQFFIASLVVLLLVIFTIRKWRWQHYILPVGLLIGLVIHGNHLINYTTFVSADVPTAEGLNTDDTPISLLIVNVKMSNREAEPTIKLIEDKNPDIVLAMEVNKWWNEKLKPLDEKYPFSKHVINEVAYGMVLFSKFPLNSVEVNYLTHEEVPSIESTVTLNNGKKLTFYAMHPVPANPFREFAQQCKSKRKCYD